MSRLSFLFLRCSPEFFNGGLQPPGGLQGFSRGPRVEYVLRFYLFHVMLFCCKLRVFIIFLVPHWKQIITISCMYFS
jgi:hypothetical protein